MTTKPQLIDWIPSVIFTAVVLVTLVASWRAAAPVAIAPRLPGQDNAPANASADHHPPPVAGEPVLGQGTPSDIKGSWPGFRGPRRDGICDDGTPLARQWPSDGPPELWRIAMTEGYAGAVISDGRVFVLDYDEQAHQDTLRCLSLDDGQEIWRNSYPVMLTRNHGITRTVPQVVGDRVITIGPRCQVACWDTETGQCHWLLDMTSEYGTVVPRWYTGQCPLVDQDRLILAPCGDDALMVAVDYETGKELWRTPNPRRWEMTHVSIMPMDVEGTRTYVYCGSGGVVGVAAEDGQLLWDTTEWPVQFAHAPSPIVLPGNRVFLCSGYGNQVGALILKVRPGEPWSANIESQLAPKQFNAEQQTPILYEGRLYGVRKRGGGQLVCMDLEGSEIWNSGTDRFGHGPYMIADGMILILGDRGRLMAVEATDQAYRPLASYEIFPDGHEAWAPLALAAGKLIARDATRMVCLDLAAQ